MSLKLTILGCFSATPRVNAAPTSQVLEIQNHNFLIDCGEGTQIELRKNKIKFNQIHHIFISHLHGDHFFGLIGLISSFGLLNREKPLTIHGPKGIKDIILLQLKHSSTWLNYTLEFNELESSKSECVFEDNSVIVSTIPLSHRVYTNGFLFKEKQCDRQLNIAEIQKVKDIDVCDYTNLKKGKDILVDSKKYLNSDFTFDPKPSLSYAFCSDTEYKPDIVSLIQNVDLLYHESTFLEQHIELAKKTKHATAKQAADIALHAKAKCLILGHYSGRYSNLELFKQEAKTVFENVELAQMGRVFVV